MIEIKVVKRLLMSNQTKKKKNKDTILWKQDFVKNNIKILVGLQLKIKLIRFLLRIHPYQT